MDPAVRRDFLAEMRDQIDRLTRLATDLLDLSRLDAGQLQVESAPFDLCAAARLVVDEFRAVAESSERELTLDGDEEVVRARRRRARAADRACVRGERDPAHTRGHADRVSVANGTAARCSRSWTKARGSREEDQEHLFQRFYRAAGGKASGSGLGLAIASELASRMDATIEVARFPAGPFSR